MCISFKYSVLQLEHYSYYHYQYECIIMCLMTGCRPSPDVVFILDTTGRDENTNMTALRETLINLLSTLDIERTQINAGFLTFTANVDEPEININRYTER
jgi:hypothetical protein